MISRPVATAPRALLLAIGPLGERAGPWHISNKLIERGYAVTHRHVLAGSSPVQALRAFRACHDIAQYELTAASDYSIGFAMAFAAIVRRARGRLAIAGMNLSRRPFRSGVAPLDHVINRIFGRVDLFIVHSTPEVSQFLHLHRLDAGRFTVVPWGFDLPDVADPECALPNRPYVAVVGRNNRDFATVARALDGTGIAGVFVGCAQPLPSVDAEIIAYESLPFDQCLGIIRGSLANVIPLNDSSRGAGHITAVAGMALGRPHIFSDADVITDYLTDGVEGIAVPLGDATAMRAAIRRLADQPALAQQMGEAGRRTATTRLTNSGFADRTAAVLLPVA